MTGDRRPRGRRLSPEEFRQHVEDVKARYNLSDIIARVTKLKRTGREFVGLCFAHEEKTGSLYVNDHLGVWLCRGCGATGDVIAAVMAIEKTDFAGAIRWLGGEILPPADPAARVKAAIEDEKDRAARAADAREAYRATSAIEGTQAETYLRSRGIHSWPTAARFARTWAWCNNETGEIGPERPALIFAVKAGGEGEFAAIQRIFLREDGAGKAAMSKPKLSLGPVRGGAVRLGPPAEHILICEGPEDGLTLRQELAGMSVWVALGTANMPNIRYPSVVRRITICGQNDGPGQTATIAAATALYEQGYEVDVRYPDAAFKDWNDQLTGRRK